MLQRPGLAGMLMVLQSFAVCLSVAVTLPSWRVNPSTLSPLPSSFTCLIHDAGPLGQATPSMAELLRKVVEARRVDADDSDSDSEWGS